jgi:hypothetical protein
VIAPAAGATVGGPSVSLGASPADGGSGVATVAFRLDGAPIGTVTSAPWQRAWDSTTTPSGAHTLDAIVTDAAGNSTTTAGVSITVDSTPPTVTLADPGALLSGNVTLAATSPDPDTVSVDFQISATGSGVWTPVATDTTPPYSTDFDTSSVSDGQFDFRAIAHDGNGNVSAPSVVAARRIDNTPPSVVSATPADGSTVSTASSISVTANEALASVTGVTLDAGGTGAPTISGATATLATGPLADGPHTLAGTLVDTAGKTSRFMTHFTIVSGPPPANWPYVEMNTFPGVTTTLTSSDGAAAVTTTGADSTPADHLVLRIDPELPAVVDGFASGSLVYDVTSYWSLTGIQLHSFSSPLQIVLSNPSGPAVVPATFENGAWRAVPLVPTAGSLPPNWADGYFDGSGNTHILTTHLTEFTLLSDRFPPSPPRDVVGVVAADGLTLRWVPGYDASGPITHVQLYVNGVLTASFDPTQFETKLGAILAGDARTFSFTDTDAAGNLSAMTTGLRALPALAGNSLADASNALAESGFTLGTVAHVRSTAPPGTVVEPADVELRLLGSAVDLTISAGPGANAAPFQLHALGPATFRPAQHLTIFTSVVATEPATASVVLRNSRGRRLASWRRPLHTGLNHPRLRLPTSARNVLIHHPGRYSLSWVAEAISKDGQASDTKRMLVVAPRRTR